METLLFTGRSLGTMVHGMALGGGALMALSAALFSLYALRGEPAPGQAFDRPSRQLVRLTVLIPILLWLTVLGGTYVTFPEYRATPPEGLADLSRYPRALILSNPGTAWLHLFAMEIKEHVPWIAAMLTTAVAFIGVRYRARLLSDAGINRIAMRLLGVSFVLVALMAVLGVFVNKVAPLE